MTERSKGDERRYQGYLKAVNGDSQAASAMFDIYAAAKPKKSSVAVDNVAIALEEALAHFTGDKKLNLGRRGYTISNGRRGRSGVVATRNE